MSSTSKATPATQYAAATSPSPSSPASPASPSSPPRSLFQIGVDLFLCTSGIYICFIGYAYIHEHITSASYGPNQDRFTHSLFLVFCQCLGNALFALLFSFLSSLFSFSSASSASSSTSVPAVKYLSMSASYIGAMYSTNWALQFMSYPAQALVKSCKMIPVMLMRIVILRKSYSLFEYLQVGLVTGGICVFMLFGQGSKHTSGPQTSWLGLGLCLISLILDGYTSPKQEQVNQKYQPSMSQMQLYMNLWAALLILIVDVGLTFITTLYTISFLLPSSNGISTLADVFHLLFSSSHLLPGFVFSSTHAAVLLPQFALFSLLSALGQYIILVTVKRFNSLIVVTITTTRKLFTIVFSVIMFGHHIRVEQWMGVGLVFVGLGLEVWEKAKKHGKKE